MMNETPPYSFIFNDSSIWLLYGSRFFTEPGKVKSPI